MVLFSTSSKIIFEPFLFQAAACSSASFATALQCFMTFKEHRLSRKSCNACSPDGRLFTHPVPSLTAQPSLSIVGRFSRLHSALELCRKLNSEKPARLLLQTGLVCTLAYCSNKSHDFSRIPVEREV